MTELLLYAICFVGTHLILSSNIARQWLRDRLGKVGFLATYSAVAGVTFWLMISAYISAPGIELWHPTGTFYYLAIGVMPLACILLVCGYTTNNPSAMGRKVKDSETIEVSGVYRITRHPVLYSIALWAAAHMLATGSAGAVVFFGALAALAILGSLHLDHRKAQEHGEPWVRFVAKTSNLPFAAIAQRRQALEWREFGVWRMALAIGLFIVMLLAHEPLVGLSPLPMPGT